MQIYQVERNDDCPCGSGRKYKRCCLSRVEEAARILNRSVGPGTYTAAGREILTTLGFMCGMSMGEGETYPDPERIGRLLKEAWEEEGKAVDAGDQEFLEALSGRLKDLLRAKEYLRSIRIPAYLLLDHDGEEDEEEEDNKEFFREIMAGLAADYDFIYEAVDAMAYSLHHESYTDDELKTLLTGVGWIVHDDARGLFSAAVIKATGEEMEEAETRVKEIMEENEEKQENDRRIMEILNRYPAYGNFIYANMRTEVQPAYQAIKKGELKLVLPLYAVAGGVYAFIANTLADLPAALVKGSIDEDFINFRWVVEILWGKREADYFIPELIRVLREQVDPDRNEEMATAVEKLVFLLGIAVLINRPVLIENLYLWSIYHFVINMPCTLPGVDLTLNRPEDLFDEQIIASYTSYLKAQGKEKEGEYVRRQFQELALEAKKKYEAGIACLLELQP